MCINRNIINRIKLTICFDMCKMYISYFFGGIILLKKKFFQEISSLIDKIETEQDGNINKAAQIISNAIADGKAIHLYDTGHILDSELIGRAGGLMCFRRLRVDFSVQNVVRKRPGDREKSGNMEGLMRYALMQSNALPGDVLIIGSVSGKSVAPVDLALCAREMGLVVIAITSIAYSSLLESMHSSKKRLFEVADLVIDNCAPPLDAMIELPGLDVSICPASGISAAVIMWAVSAQVVDILLAKGIRPTIYKSINFPGSKEFNEKEYKRYEETGY